MIRLPCTRYFTNGIWRLDLQFFSAKLSSGLRDWNSHPNRALNERRFLRTGLYFYNSLVLELSLPSLLFMAFRCPAEAIIFVFCFEWSVDFHSILGNIVPKMSLLPFLIFLIPFIHSLFPFQVNPLIWSLMRFSFYRHTLQRNFLSVVRRWNKILITMIPKNLFKWKFCCPIVGGEWAISTHNPNLPLSLFLPRVLLNALFPF